MRLHFAPKGEINSKRVLIHTSDDIQKELHVALDSLEEKDFCCAFKSWKTHWDHCVRSQGDYFKGDGNLI